MTKHDPQSHHKCVCEPSWWRGATGKQNTRWVLVLTSHRACIADVDVCLSLCLYVSPAEILARWWWGHTTKLGPWEHRRMSPLTREDGDGQATRWDAFGRGQSATDSSPLVLSLSLSLSPPCQNRKEEETRPARSQWQFATRPHRLSTNHVTRDTGEHCSPVL